jgi:hypothetical protein
VGVVGWGLIEFERGAARPETEIHLLIASPVYDCGVVLPVFELEDSDTVYIRVFAPHEQITDTDKKELETNTKELHIILEQEKRQKVSAA